jgi:glycosyltransferase involved in cell wall biosynthesis
MFRQITPRNAAVQLSKPLPIANPKETSPGRLSVLHVATLNQPIKSGLGYGPIETVIYNIDKGLHALGHRSIVACSADSRVTGEHYITVGQSTGSYCSDNTPRRRLAWDNHLALALERASRHDIDVVHLHDADAVQFFHKRMSQLRVPMILTLHVAAEESGLAGRYQAWTSPAAAPSVTCVAISEHQRLKYQHMARIAHVVHHGVDIDRFPQEPLQAAQKYLFAIGRITQGKGQDNAIELAKRTGRKLIIAGCVQNKAADREYFTRLQPSIDLVTKVDHLPADRHYFDRIMKPLLESDKQIIYVGELSGEHKAQWYRHALATVFPIQWDEPFGLVLIESMAYGTPVIAFDRGAVPELVVQGKTGFVVDSISAMVGAVGWVEALDREECRQHVRRHFSIEKMTGSYSALYRQVIHARHVHGALAPVPHKRPFMTAPLVTVPS